MMLNGGKGFVCSAAMAAAFVLLAGGANALANTVWYVSTTSTNATCALPTPTTCNTIGAAVSAAAPGDVISVGPGTYNESVQIAKSNLSIFGAQVGKDARVDRHDSTKESIVDATGQGSGPGSGAAFDIEGLNVVIDGFTIQGGTAGTKASGIYAEEFYIQIVNNIIQNNAVGIYANVPIALVEHNRFLTNNTPTAGTADTGIAGMSGFGIAGVTFSGTAITENAFKENKAAAMYFYSSTTGGAVTENTSEKDGSFVVFNGCDSTIFSHNQGRDFGAKGFLPVIGTADADAAIDVISSSISNLQLQINNNDLEEGKTAGYSGIAFSATVIAPAADVCIYCQVSNNTIRRFAGNGIVAEATDTYGTLGYSLVSLNAVEDNGNDGILIGNAPDNNFNSLFDNYGEDNQVFDCADDTPPTVLLGTLSTADTWFSNVGRLSYPTGLCTHGRRHYHD
jgi:hypothetical protein